MPSHATKLSLCGIRAFETPGGVKPTCLRRYDAADIIRRTARMSDGSKLPKGVQAKLLHLDDAAHQAQALISSTIRRVGELERLLVNNPDGPSSDAIREEITLLRRKQSNHADRYRECADVNAAIRRYLESLPANVVVEDAKRTKVKLKPGENYSTAVERVRREIAGLVSERLRVQQAGLPIEEIREKARDWITQRSRLARPYVTANHDQFTVRFDVYVENAPIPITDVAAIMAWLYPERFAKKINEIIDQMPKPVLALSAEEKSQRLREIKGSLYELEVEEESLISAAEEQGHIIARRVTADPKAILGLVLNRSKANAA
ncbi:hypothetical protein [Bradyrhizobium arachidis]|uniref:hypothetical protein n=1 Tax=Bradyrhizobium arachidis TaxID=858423 RepID=UPI002162C9D8|nr:hypothetical protein [Bradyrhizobium arachidis]UVO28343.1 hypothetical protein KUF59_38775 [Bradyrhizobium arachidis]